jgi:(hydroxyamino)benzene mutase
MESSSTVKRQADQLIFFGVLLFLLGLIVGLMVPVLANPRMGLSSHIEGVMNGMLLIIFGLIWNRVKLSDKWLKITFWLVIYGTFANWFGILIAAIFNAGKMLTVAAKGQEGHPVAEAVVTFSLVTLTLAMIFVSVAILIGLAKGARSKNAVS